MQKRTHRAWTLERTLGAGNPQSRYIWRRPFAASLLLNLQDLQVIGQYRPHLRLRLLWPTCWLGADPSWSISIHYICIQTGGVLGHTARTHVHLDEMHRIKSVHPLLQTGGRGDGVARCMRAIVVHPTHSTSLFKLAHSGALLPLSSPPANALRKSSYK